MSSKPLVELYHQVRTSDTLRNAARLSDGPWKVCDGVLGRAKFVRVLKKAEVALPFEEEYTSILPIKGDV